MDYEKKYKDALGRAKAAIKVAEYPEDVRKVAETIFPELRESEDEKIKKTLIGYFTRKNEYRDVDELWEGLEIPEIIAWLNSLHQQPKQEWSDEDEEHLDSIIESYKELLKVYSANNGVDYIPYYTPGVARTVLNDIKFLKSLRPQPHWKPREEQMRALAAITKNLLTERPEKHRLESLYNDLKEL